MTCTCTFCFWVRIKRDTHSKTLPHQRYLVLSHVRTLLENMSKMYFIILLFTATQIAIHSPQTNRLHAGLHGPMNVDGA